VVNQLQSPRSVFNALSEGDFFVNVLDKTGNTNHFYVVLKRSLQRINFTDRKATMPRENEIDNFHHLLSESVQMPCLRDEFLSFKGAK